MLSRPSRWGVSKSIPRSAARPAYSSGRSSKMATMPGSPRRMPSAMNWVAKTDLPDPDGPAINTLSPSGIPPPIIASSSGTPHASRRRSRALSLRPVRPKVRGNAWMPSPVMRKVCSPGTDACPGAS